MKTDTAYYTNSNMKLVLVARKLGNAVFARLDGTGSIYDFVVGKGCLFIGKTVTWSYGHYNMDYNSAMKALED